MSLGVVEDGAAYGEVDAGMSEDPFSARIEALLALRQRIVWRGVWIGFAIGFVLGLAVGKFWL